MRAVEERRGGGDRRSRRLALRFPERRTGFDQRRPTTRGLVARYQRAILEYREKRSAFMLVLASIVVFNYIDLLLTLRALELGATEANPIMAWLFERSPVVAASVKLSISGAVVLVLLMLGRFRRVLEASLVILVAHSALMVWHVILAIQLA